MVQYKHYEIIAIEKGGIDKSGGIFISLIIDISL